MFSEEKLSGAGQKKQQIIDIKFFCLSTSYGLEHEKTASVNYLLKFS